MNCYTCCDGPHISAYTQQLCAIKAKLSQIEDLQAEMNSANNSKGGCDCNCCCSMQNALISLLKDIVNKCVTDDEFEEYKRWIEAQGYLKAIPDYYLTEDELKEILKNLFGDGWNRELQRILDDYVKKADLPEYIRRWIEQNLSNYLANYVTRPELASYYTKAQIDSMFGNYYDKAAVDALLRQLEGKIPNISDVPGIGDFNWVPDPGVETATGRYKIGDLYLAGKKYAVYGKDNQGSGSGSSGSDGTDGTDGVSSETITVITEKVNEAIENLKATINQQNSWADAYVRSIISNALSHANWMKNNTTLDEIYHIGDEDAWDNTLKQYMRETGLVTTDANGNIVSYKWSEWLQKFDTMFQSVTALVNILDEEGQATELREIFDSRFSQWASEQEVGVDLTSLAALFDVTTNGTGDGEKLKRLLNFALVGYQQYADFDDNSLAQAWQSLKTLGQNNMQGGGFATNSGVDSAVNNTLGKATASISASTTIYKILRNSQGPVLRDSNGDYQYADANGNYGGVGPYTVIYLDKNNNPLRVGAPLDERVIEDQNIAGFISQADLESSIATMFASGGEKMASITTGVMNSLEDNSSFINAVADSINLDGNVNITGDMIAQKISGTDLNLTGNVTAQNAYIKGHVNATFLTGSIQTITSAIHQIQPNDGIRAYVFGNSGIDQQIQLPDATSDNNGVEIQFFKLNGSHTATVVNSNSGAIDIITKADGNGNQQYLMSETNTTSCGSVVFKLVNSHWFEI